MDKQLLASELEEKGYAIIRKFWSNDQIERLKGIYYNVPRNGEIPNLDITVFSQDSEYKNNISNGIMQVFAENEMPLEGFTPINGVFINKKAKSSSECPLHRDPCFVNEGLYRTYTFWGPLVPLTNNNGPLTVVPFSHKYYRNVRGYSPVEFDFPLMFDNKTIVDQFGVKVKLEVGDVIVYDTATYHYSDNNYSSKDRPVAAVLCRHAEAQALYYDFLEDSINVYGMTDAEVLEVSSPIFKEVIRQRQPLRSLPRFNYTVKHEFFSDKLARHKVSFFDRVKSWFGSNKQQNAYAEHIKEVDQHFDSLNFRYLRAYGDVIEASRSEDISETLAYLSKELPLEPNTRILDAGCGVAGPLAYFASQSNATFHGITITKIQKDFAEQNIQQKGLRNVSIVQGDYHLLENYFKASEFNLVYFLESFCHCYDPEKLVKSVKQVLKKGGTLYMKDWFLIYDLKQENPELFPIVVERINQFYNFNFKEGVSDAPAIVSLLEREGFDIVYVREPQYSNEKYRYTAEFHGHNEYLGKNDTYKDNHLIGELPDVFKTIKIFEIKATLK